MADLTSPLSTLFLASSGSDIISLTSKVLSDFIEFITRSVISPELCLTIITGVFSTVPPIPHPHNAIINIGNRTNETNCTLCLHNVSRSFFIIHHTFLFSIFNLLPSFCSYCYEYIFQCRIICFYRSYISSFT